MNEKTAVVTQTKTIDIVTQRIRHFQSAGELSLPVDYSAENALKSAWLIMQDLTDKNKQPALQVCTQTSIANALLDMVVQALSPAKRQCYFVVYGNKITCMRSYFGSMAIAKRVDNRIVDICAEVVYSGDVFRYAIKNGKKEILVHEQEIGNIGHPVLAAYCVVIGENDKPLKTEIMTIDEIHQAWKQSRNNPIDDQGKLKDGAVHHKFISEMCKKTVINRSCKTIINSSSDSNVFRQAAKRADEIQDEVEFEEKVEQEANKEVIDIKPVQTQIEQPSTSAQPKEDPKKEDVHSENDPGF